MAHPGITSGELEELRERLREAEETLAAIRSGDVDSLVVHGPSGPMVYSLPGADAVYRELMDGMGEGALSLDPEGVITYGNRRVAEMLGHPLERVVGQELLSLVTGEARGLLARFLERAWKGRTQTELELPGAGEVGRPVLVSAVQVRDGQPLLCIVVADLSESRRASEARRKAEEALRASETLLRTMADATPDLIFAKDLQGRCTFANAAALRLLGRREEEVLGRTDVAILGDDAFARQLRANDRRVLEIGTALHLEEAVPGPEGLRHFLASKAPLRDARGEVVGLVGVATDITDRKAMEQALRESSRYTRTLIEAQVDPLVVIDPAGIVTDVNAATEAATGIPRDRLVGTDFAELCVDLESARLAVREALSKGKVHDVPLHLRRGDGSSMEVLLNASVYRGEGGEVQGIFAAARDMTALRRAEELLRQAQKMEAVGQLAGGIAHDFNNLLTVILFASNFALQNAPKEGALRGDIEEVRQAAQKARVLTQQLLAFGRRQVLVTRILDLNQVVQEAERLLARLLGEHVRLRTELEAGLAPVLADAGQILQVVMNLAINGRDAMPDGGTLTIRTQHVEKAPEACREAAGRGPWARLTVEDTGTGMDEDTRAHIFEPFFTTKEHGRGTGLGLAMVYGVVQQSSGVVCVHTEPGAGTRFEVYLPLHAGSTLAAPPPPVRAPSATVSGTTVLVVEDQSEVLRVMERMLGQAGFEVIAAENLEEAIRKVSGCPKPPRVLLTDVRMPVVGGPEVSEALTRRIPGLRTIYMSGYSGAEMESNGGLPRGSHFLQKPFTAEEFAAKLREAVEA